MNVYVSRVFINRSSDLTRIYFKILILSIAIVSCQFEKIEKRSIVNRFTNNPLFLSHFDGASYNIPYSRNPWASTYSTQGK